MQSLGNHSFGGKTPLKISKKAFRKQSAKPYLSSTMKPDLMGETGQKSIYELITQNIKMPEGLLYRGKYCGKSKLRTKIDEFGFETRSNATMYRR